jgi:hypothetical protein
MVSRILILPAILSLLFAASSARAAFVLGVNLGGDAVTINGSLWQSEAAASANGYSVTTSGSFAQFTYNAVPAPAVDAQTATMLNDVRYVTFGTPSVTVHQAVPNGLAYILQLWSFEAVQAFGRSADISGDVTSTNFNNLPLNGAEAPSFLTGIINDGSIDFTITTVNNQPVLSGFAIFSAVVVPEPAAGSLALCAMAALVRRRRRGR